MEKKYKDSSSTVLYDPVTYKYDKSIESEKEIIINIPFKPKKLGIHVAEVFLLPELIFDGNSSNNVLHIFFDVVPSYPKPAKIIPTLDLNNSDVFRTFITGGWISSPTSYEKYTLKFGFFLCPSGRVRGFSSINNYFGCLECGTWKIENPPLVTINMTSKCNDESTDKWSTNMSYDSIKHCLILRSLCDILLYRAQGELSDQNCIKGSCSEGGTGDITNCRADFDRGRCRYCENGTCRYGGEGPYECYRDWDPGE